VPHTWGVLSTKDVADVGIQFRVAEAKFGSSDNSGKLVSYKLTVKRGEVFSHQTVWYDPETFKLFKRVHKTDELLIEESYEKYVLDQAIPDDQFNLPDQ